MLKFKKYEIFKSFILTLKRNGMIMSLYEQYEQIARKVRRIYCYRQ